MSNSTFLIATALGLASCSLNALLKGLTVATVTKTFVRVGQQFVLCSRPEELDTDAVQLQAWARCEKCYSVDNLSSLDELSRLTALTPLELEQIIGDRQSIFVSFLRVYWLTSPVESVLNFNGQFAALQQTLSVNTSFPVLNDVSFDKRKNLEISLYPQIEELEIGLNKLAVASSDAKNLLQKVHFFLGSVEPSNSHSEITLDWIKDIEPLGSRSKEYDISKSNWRAGTDFELIVHKSLNFLGFQIDKTHKGGAGGLDLFCHAPYPLVGECKCGQGIPSNTVYQLDKLLDTHFESSDNITKLIIGPGRPTKDLRKVAQKRNISIIKPMTLQKLVEVNAKYPNSVNLIELKDYLKPGETDDSINEFIEEKVLKRLRLRSHVVQELKRVLTDKKLEDINFEQFYPEYQQLTESIQLLADKELHELLVELSSPLVGYLGRYKDDHWWNDRFYFLRDLIID